MGTIRVEVRKGVKKAIYDLIDAEEANADTVRSLGEAYDLDHALMMARLYVEMTRQKMIEAPPVAPDEPHARCMQVWNDLNQRAANVKLPTAPEKQSYRIALSCFHASQTLKSDLEGGFSPAPFKALGAETLWVLHGKGVTTLGEEKIPMLGRSKAAYAASLDYYAEQFRNERRATQYRQNLEHVFAIIMACILDWCDA